jgi:hypothetical protein
MDRIFIIIKKGSYCMRKVVLNIAKLGLVAGNVIKIQLVNSVGAVTISPMGYSFDSSFTLSSALFEVDLLENEAIPTLSSYKITLPNTLSFTFNVPFSYNYTEPHDLVSLLNIGCVHGLIDQDTKTLDEDFVSKINLYFTGENPHFSEVQKNIMKLYEYYANEVIDTTYTIDVIELMDAYLSTLIREINV